MKKEISSKEIVQELAKFLCLEVSDQLADKIVKEIQDLENEYKSVGTTAETVKASPVNYPRVVNCAKFRIDKENIKKNKPYLAGAKMENKYVVGK